VRGRAPILSYEYGGWSHKGKSALALLVSRVSFVSIAEFGV
jgi:hypothetical protein